MPFLIDTHAHLDAEVYAGELQDVVKRALQDDIWIVTVGSDLASSRRAVEIAEMFPEGVFAAVGLHPLKVPADVSAQDKVLDLEGFRQLAQHPKVVALGETGLDFHDLALDAPGDPARPLAEKIKKNQINALGAFLQLSKEFRLPLLLHCREAHAEMLDLLETWDKTSAGFDARGIVHCFSGDWKDARRYFNLDFMISVTGLFANAGYQADLIRKVPLQRLAVESDCPYLTPDAWSSRRSEPSFIGRLAETLAGIHGESKAAVAAQTTENALKIFGRMKRLV
ncbi:TatD family hydrolase [Candidatus Uhrbacteria bacterium]|nr:TatD family hydrolase [Candidatus Uhrbacteria bacterium]